MAQNLEPLQLCEQLSTTLFQYKHVLKTTQAHQEEDLKKEHESSKQRAKSD